MMGLSLAQPRSSEATEALVRHGTQAPRFDTIETCGHPGELVPMERLGHMDRPQAVLRESGRTVPCAPASGEQTHEVDFASVEEVDRAVETARGRLRVVGDAVVVRSVPT